MTLSLNIILRFFSSSFFLTLLPNIYDLKDIFTRFLFPFAK